MITGYENRTDKEILDQIEIYQSIQKSCAPTTRKWKRSSQYLKPLFAEMARRQQVDKLVKA